MRLCDMSMCVCAVLYTENAPDVRIVHEREKCTAELVCELPCMLSCCAIVAIFMMNADNKFVWARVCVCFYEKLQFVGWMQTARMGERKKWAFLTFPTVNKQQYTQQPENLKRSLAHLYRNFLARPNLQCIQKSNHIFSATITKFHGPVQGRKKSTSIWSLLGVSFIGCDFYIVGNGAHRHAITYSKHANRIGSFKCIRMIILSENEKCLSLFIRSFICAVTLWVFAMQLWGKTVWDN